MPPSSLGKTYQKHLICLGLSFAIHLFVFLLLQQFRIGLSKQLNQALLSYEKSLLENFTVTNLVAPKKPAPSKITPHKVKPVLTKRKTVKLVKAQILRPKLPQIQQKKIVVQEKPPVTKITPPPLQTAPRKGPATKILPSAPPLSHPGFAGAKQVAYLDKSISPILQGANHFINIAPPAMTKKISLLPRIVKITPTRKSTTDAEEVLASPQYYSPPIGKIPSGKLVTIDSISKPSLKPIATKGASKIKYQAKAMEKINIKIKPISPPIIEKAPQTITNPQPSKKMVMIPSEIITAPPSPPLITFARRNIAIKKIAPTLQRLAKKRSFPGKRAWTSYINDVLLRQGRVSAIAVDKEGAKWFGMEQGLVRYHRGRWRLYTTSDGLAGDKVYSVSIDTAGNKWLGTNAGVSRFDGQRWQTFSTEDGLAGKHVHGIAEDNQGHQWFATNGGVSEFDGKKWATYTTRDGLIDNKVIAVAIDKQGKKWFATSKGVSCFDGKKWQNYTTKNSGLADNTVYAVAVDNTNDKWFGTDSGASRFDGKRWKNFNKKNGLAGNSVYAIGINKLGEKWFGTDNGISRYNDLTWKQYGTRNGLTSKYVFSVASDDKGNQWFGTDNGVSELAFK